MYSIIYDAINDIKAAMEGMLAPKFKERIVGRAEVREERLLPVGQDPSGAVSHQVTAPVDSEQIKFSIGYDRPGSWVPVVLGRVVAGIDVLHQL